jgi:hypothetical protein
VQLEGLGKLKKLIDLIGNQNLNLPACSIVPQPTMLPLTPPRHMWMDNLKMDFREIGWGGIDWIYQTQDRDHLRTLVNKVMNL